MIRYAADFSVAPALVRRTVDHVTTTLHEQSLSVAMRTMKTAPALSAARTYAKLGMATKARSALDAFERTVTDSLIRARNQQAVPPILVELAIAERRWADAAAILRREDQQPDGPASDCVYCLSLDLLKVFAIAGQADSALAQYDTYRRTAMGRDRASDPTWSCPPGRCWRWLVCTMREVMHATRSPRIVIM